MIFYATGRKVQKKFCRGIEQVREAGRRKIKPFLFGIIIAIYVKEVD